MNLDGADKDLSRKHRRRVHKSDLLVISVFTFSQTLVALVSLNLKSTPAPSSYQVFKSSNLHLNKSQSLHTCKQSTRNPMLTVNNIFYLLYLKKKKIKRLNDYWNNRKEKCNFWLIIEVMLERNEKKAYLRCNDALVFLLCYYKDRLVHWISGRTYRWYSTLWAFTVESRYIMSVIEHKS